MEVYEKPTAILVSLLGCEAFRELLFIERYFWDTDVLMVAEIWSRLSTEAKQHLGLRDALFGVVHGLAPHPDELVLQRVEDGEVS